MGVSGPILVELNDSYTLKLGKITHPPVGPLLRGGAARAASHSAAPAAHHFQPPIPGPGQRSRISWRLQDAV